MSETLELKPLTAYETNKAELIAFVEDYKNLVVTAETFEAAKKARLVIREKRYAIQAIEKSNNNQLNALKKQNTSNAEELIAVLTSTEERIDAGIKAIEEVKEKEKQEKLKLAEEKHNKKIALLLETGCLFNGSEYALNNVVLLATDVRNLSDKDFEKVLSDFKVEQERVTIIKARYDALIKMGMSESGAHFEYPKNLFPDSSACLNKDVVCGFTHEEFSDILVSIEKEILNTFNVVKEKEQQRIDKANKIKARCQELFDLEATYDGGNYYYGEAQLVSNESVGELNDEQWKEKLIHIKGVIDHAKKVASDKLADEKKLADQNAELLKSRTSTRQQVLYSLGLALAGEKFAFHNIEITTKQIQEYSEVEWVEASAIITKKVADKKLAIENQLALDKESAIKLENERLAKIEAMKPDKEKLLAFARALQQTSVPELSTEYGRILCEKISKTINDVSQEVIDSLNSL